jgi:hypothetical protein
MRRICTLVRKQGANRLIIESVAKRPDVKTEIDALDDSFGGGGAAEAVCFSFLFSELGPGRPLDSAADLLLGQAILINYRPPRSSNFGKSYVYEAILSPPTRRRAGNQTEGLLNNFIHFDGNFDCIVSGTCFSISGIYYAQQNAQTHVCAHACLRMILNTMLSKIDVVSGQSINNLLGRLPSKSGLTIQDVEAVIQSVPGLSARVIDCSQFQDQVFSSSLVSVVESGHMALLVFTTGGSDEHVVTVFGHTRNTDEWHPQALPVYSGAPSAPYYPSSSWVDHFTIHDDNFGPYYSLSNRALSSLPAVKPHWIVAVRRSNPALLSVIAEILAAIQLANALPSFVSLSSNRWFDYITRGSWAYVLRTILVTKELYLKHLSAAIGHDGTRFTASELKSFDIIPEEFWMVEFSLPYLYTGNRSKLGEVLISTENLDAGNLEKSILGFRLPGLVLLPSQSGKFAGTSVSLLSHIPLFMSREHDQEW